MRIYNVQFFSEEGELLTSEQISASGHEEACQEADRMKDELGADDYEINLSPESPRSLSRDLLGDDFADIVGDF